jgi:hypothetical protein
MGKKPIGAKKKTGNVVLRVEMFLAKHARTQFFLLPLQTINWCVALPVTFVATLLLIKWRRLVAPYVVS